MKSLWARHFAAEHPLFRKDKTSNGIWWEESVYYFWWEFLRANSDYADTCRKKGKGKCAKLYEDFGDVYKTDFKTWWTTGGRGARLFAEPAMPVDIRPLSSDELKQLPDDYERHLIVLAIDKSLPMRAVISKVRRAFQKSGNSRKRGQKTSRQSRATYPLATTFDPRALKTTFEVYEFHQQNPDARLWQIGHEFRLAAVLTKEELAEAQTRKTKLDDRRYELDLKKNVLAVAARRYIRNAESLIKWAGKGKFPVFTTTKIDA